MQTDSRYTNDHHCCHSGYCFIKAGLWFFIIGLVLGFGVLIHYLVGSAYDNTQNFVANIQLWFGSPLMLSSGYLQIGGLAMAIIGGLYLWKCKCCRPVNTTTSPSSLKHDDTCRKTEKSALALCYIGLIGLLLTGYIGYFVIDMIWPGFYYAAIPFPKNLWLILQGISILLFLIGIIVATGAFCKCKKDICGTDHHHT